MTDITRRGPRDYDDQTRDRVLFHFGFLAGQGRSVQVEDLAKASGVPGRTVRQIMSDNDSVPGLRIDMPLGGGDEGYDIAEYAEDMEPLTNRLRATANSLMERVERREAAAARLPRRQRGLF